MTIGKPCFIFNKIVIYKLLFICVLFFLSALQTNAQAPSEKGLPFITNYRYQDYGADGTNWWATEDDNGVLYFANTKGVLTYDGSQWELLKPSGVRCVEKGKDGKIYLGTNGDIGYLFSDKKGKLQFVSLKDKLPEKYRSFQEVWEMGTTSTYIYFKTNNFIFIWDYNKMRVVESTESFHITSVIHDQLYTRIWNRGLTVLKNDSFYVVPNGEKFTNERIYVMLPYDEKNILIGTRTQGLFLYDGNNFTPFKTEADPYIFNTSLYGGLVLSNGLFALNTFNNGLVIINRQGKLIQRIDKSMGLQDNSVDQLFEDSRGILWMPLFNGIAKLDLHSSFTFFDESMGLPAKTVFNAVSINDTVYAGTNNGVYFLDKSTNRFKYVTGTIGQVYDIQKFKNYVIVGGAEKGFLKISAGKASPLIEGVNYDFHVQHFIQSKIDSTVFYFDLRNGIATVRYNPKTGSFAIESSRNDVKGRRATQFLETEDGNLWVSGNKSSELILLKPDRSAGKVNIANAPLIVYDNKKGLPIGGVSIGVYDGTAYFVSSADSIFTFNKKTDRFIQDTGSFLKKYIEDDADGAIISPTDQNGRIWANYGTGMFVKIPAKDGSYKIIEAPFRELKKNNPVWSINPTIDKNGNTVVWFAGRDGIVRYDGNLEEATSRPFKTIIRGITLNEDSVFYSGFTLPADKSAFSHQYNSVRFKYAAPFFKQENETLFASLLEGRDKNWSDWNKQNFRDFGNLPAGNYTFRVKSKNIYDTESPESSFTFIILPPWWASWWAYLLYAIAIVAIIYSLIRWRTRQLHEKHRELEKTVTERTAQLSERVEELAVINSVQESLVAKMDIKGIYELVGEKIRDIFQAQVIDIVTYDPQNNLIEDQYAYENGDRTLLGSREPKGFRKHVIQTSQLLLHNANVEQAMHDFDNTVLIGEIPKSQVFVPMIAAGKVKGIISLQNLDHEQAFSTSDINLLTTLANSMTVALESARLFDETTRLLKETEQRNAELAVINSVQESLVAKMDIKGIYELVGEKIREIFDAQVIDIVTYDREKNLIKDMYSFEKGDRTLIGLREPKGFRKHVIQTSQLLLHNSNVEQAMQDFGNAIVIGEVPKSQVFVPMIAAGKVKGIISLQNLDHEQAFSNSDISLLTTLANSMSVALESARLFDETTRLLKETEQRTAELAVINSVQDGLAKELDMDGIYNLVGDRVQQLFNAQVVIIASFDLDKKMEYFNYAFENGEKVKTATREINKLRQLLIDNKRCIYITTEEQAKAEYGLTAIPGTKMPKSLLFVPLLTGNIIRGYISLQNIDKENAFSDADIRLLETLVNSMSVALENARLFDETTRLLKETEQRTAELSVINSVQDGLAKELDIQGIYNLVGEKIREIFTAQVIDIVTYDPKLNLIEDRYSYEKGDRTLLGAREPKGFRKNIIETGQSLVINYDYEAASAKFDNTILIGEQPKSAVVVPMMSGGKVNGMLSLQNLDRENAFSEADVNLLNTLANSMSVALESARLFDETNRLLKETEQRTAELSVINSVQEGLAKELDIQGIYNLVGEKIRDIFNAQVFDIVTYDPKLNIIEDRYAYEKGDTTLLGPREPNGIRKKIIDAGQPVIINYDYEKISAQYGSTVLIGEQPKSAVIVPLISGGKVNGMISIQNLDHEYAFSDADINLLTTLANSMSVALESARLFDETNRLLKETEQRTAELSVINSVQEGLAKELDIQGIYELIGEKMREIFNAQVFDIVTYDKITQLIEDRYTYEKGDRSLLGPRPLSGFRKHVIEKGQTLVINNNMAKHMRELGNVVMIGEQSKSVVFVPMFASGEVTGVISLQNIDQENAFSPSDVRLLTTLGNSMSVALESARLFDETNRLLKETEKRTEELSVINSVQEGLAKEPDINGIYELVGEKVREVFNAQAIDIVTYDKKAGLIEDRYTYEKGDRTLLGKRPLKGFRKHVIETGKILLINKDVDKLRSTFDNTVIVGQAAKSLIFVPMITGVEVTGVISLQNLDKENAFSDADVNLLTTFSNSMTVALENARLFDETTHLLAEAKQRATELSTVNNISRALASQLDADDLIKLVGDQLKDLFKANIVYLALLNKKTKTIYFPYQFGDDMEPMKLGEGLTSKIIVTGEPLLINKDVDEQTVQMGIKSVGLSSASYLGVPIPVGDEIIGVLSVQTTEQENRFNENDLRLLSTIASSVGVALRNATLFEDVKLAKMEAEAASKLAEKANEAKSAFLSTVSHELRTPLTSVLGFAKIIEKRLVEKIFPIVDKSDAKTGKTINQISDNLHIVISEGERLTHLINDVLDLAKIEAGKMEWNQENVSMAEVAERAIAATTSLFDQKSLKLIKQIDDNLPDITGDKDKLIQVIINLISNSVKFTDKGSITCKVSKKKNELVVSITDTGIGIAEEDFGAVFEQFKQVGGDTLTDKPKGTGLGLPICKEIVEHHGGRIWLESAQGKGSTFSFALPVIKGTASSRPIHLDDLVKQLKERVAISQIHIQGQASNILIVDDDESIRTLLHQELGDAGYNIIEARNGKEALACVRKQRPDLIILDIMMPEMNGFDVAAVLKNDPETMDIPIIVLSVVQDKARGFRIGIDRYLTKPIDTGLLFAEIGSLLEQGKSKKKVMIVDEDSGAVSTLTDVLTTKGYEVMEANENELLEQAVKNLPDIIIISSGLSGKQDIVKTLRFEKGLENVLFLVYQ